MRVELTSLHVSAEVKQELVQSLRYAMEQGEIALQNDEYAKSELAAFEAKLTPTGKMRYSAPPTMHDDTVMARCLAFRAREKAGESVIKASVRPFWAGQHTRYKVGDATVAIPRYI